jgi:DNA-directed RNA polymerase specialized sigma24 family protein
MGKKLNRNAAKLRMTHLQEARRERVARAGLLLERWGQQDRQPMLQPLAESEQDSTYIEDQMTNEVINSLTHDTRDIARLHWASGLSAAEIADQQVLSRNEVRQHLGFVVEQVANKVLM